MFKKITTTALLAGLALTTATTLPVSGAMAHATSGSHGGKSASGGHGGHSSSAGRDDRGGSDRGDRGGDRGGDRSYGGGTSGWNPGGVGGTVGTALGVAHALGIPGF